jgi:dienelactone hydrolase
MSCCKIDSIHTGHPRGTIQTINNISTYITFPPGTTTPPASDSSTTTPTPKYGRALLVLPEVHGLVLPNVLLLADIFARELGCPVIAPNLFGTDPFPVAKPDGWDDEKELEAFQARHHPGTVDPILDALIDWVQQPVSSGGFGGVRSLGGVGYCFGGRYVIRLLAAGKIDAGAVNHPSFFTIEEVRSLVQRRPRGAMAGSCYSPLAIFAAEEDDIFPESKRRATEDVLKEIGAAWWCSTFGGTEHGFRYVVAFLSLP